MQDMAVEHAYKLGFGFEAMRGRKMLWLLCRSKLVYESLPDKHFPVLGITHWRGTKGIFFLRDHEFYQNGNRIAYSLSAWVVADWETHRVLRGTAIDFGDCCQAADIPEIALEKLEKYKRAVDETPVFERVARYSDLDINHHMNNARYIEWVMDIFPYDWHLDRSVASVQINYSAEVLPEEKIKLYRNDTGQLSYVWGQKDDGRQAFECLVEWTKNLKTLQGES